MMGEFVKNELREIDFRIIDEGVENGVVEESESGVGVDAAYEGIESLRFELIDERLCVFFLKIAPIILLPDDGIPPSFGFE